MFMGEYTKLGHNKMICGLFRRFNLNMNFNVFIDHRFDILRTGKRTDVFACDAKEYTHKNIDLKELNTQLNSIGLSDFLKIVGGRDFEVSYWFSPKAGVLWFKKPKLKIKIIKKVGKEEIYDLVFTFIVK